MNLKAIYFSVILILAYSCKKDRAPSISEIVADYYQVYEKRLNFDQFLNFYSDQFVLEDIIAGSSVSDKLELELFFDWQNPDFRKSNERLFVITNQIIDKQNVVTEGYFMPFYWGDNYYEAMHFTTVLTFNTQGKIVKHRDWINYPANLLDYNSRNDSNEWIRQE